MRPLEIRLGAVVLLSSAMFALATGGAVAQQAAPTDKMPMDHQKMMQMHGPAGMAGMGAPTLPGQDAFGAVQEIVRLLEADPKTDWSKVNLEALRQHLIDMNEVTLKADAVATPVDGGVEIAISGSGRTLAAIQRMIPAWAATMNGYKGWTTKVVPLPTGDLLTVTAADAREVTHIRGLGFIGLMASGAHHQPHHLAMAKGQFDPAGHHHP